MSIEVYSGGLGGGKSYSGVVSIMRLFSQGKKVVTNIAVDLDKAVEYVRNQYGVRMEPAIQYRQITQDEISSGLVHTLIPVAEHDSGDVGLVVDEAAEWFDSYDSPKLQAELMSWFRHARKVGVDVVLIVQDIGMIQKRIRVLVDFEIRHINMRTQLRIPGLGIRWPTKHMCRVLFDRWGKYVSRTFYYPDSRIFALYRTQECYRSLCMEGTYERQQLARESVVTKPREIAMWLSLFASMGVALYGLFFASKPLASVGPAVGATQSVGGFRSVLGGDRGSWMKYGEREAFINAAGVTYFCRGIYGNGAMCVYVGKTGAVCIDRDGGVYEDLGAGLQRRGVVKKRVDGSGV